MHDLEFYSYSTLRLWFKFYPIVLGLWDMLKSTARKKIAKQIESVQKIGYK